MKFNHLNVPTHWQNYWTRYPEGHTILESLISWVSQVDSMVDNVNSWNEYLDNFVATFDKELQKTVTDTLSDWQNSGFIDVVITEAIQWELDDFKETTEQNLLSVEQQLQQTEQSLKAEVEETKVKINRFNNNLSSNFVKMGNLDEFKTALATGSVNVAFAGDSITGSGNYLDVNDRWVEQYQKEFKKKFPDVTFTFKNFGIGGLTLEQFANKDYIPDQFYLDRWGVSSGTSWLNAVDLFAPDLLFIAFGMNPNSNGAKSTGARLNEIDGYYKTKSNPSLVLLSNLVPNKNFPGSWYERFISSRYTKLYSLDWNHSFFDIFNKYRMLVDGKDETQHIATLHSSDEIVMNQMNGRNETNYTTLNFKIEFNAEFTDSNRFDLYYRSGDILFISAVQLAFSEGAPVSLPNLTGNRKVSIEVREKLVIKIDDVVYYDKFLYGSQREDIISFKFNGIYSDLKIITFDFMDVSNTYTQNDIFGEYKEGDYETKSPHGGNGANHPSSIGYNLIYVPMIKEFLNKLK